MKKLLSLILSLGFLTNVIVATAQDAVVNSPAGASTNNASANEVVPLITIDEVPLTDAIRNLARMANLNFQFDPKVLAVTNGPDGKPISAPPVSLRWENITPLQALHALLENNSLQLIQDEKTGIARITTKDSSALEPLVSRIIPLRYSNPTNMIPLIKSTFGTPTRSQVLADTRTSQLVVLATQREMDTIEKIITQLDTSPSQILIEARFLETTRNPKSLKGIDWSGTLAAQNVRMGNTSQFIDGLEPKAPTATVPGFPGETSGVLVPAPNPALIASTASGFGGVGYLNADGVSAVISFLNSDAETETIATPRAVALEGTAVDLSVVRNIPIFEEQQGANTGGSVQPSTVKPNYNLQGPSGTALSEVGVRLIVTPTIYGVSNVFLDLKPEISEVGPNATTVLNGKPSSAPTFLRKKLSTQAMVPSGNTLVLGGLREDGTKRTRTKVPLLGDLPGLGAFFRSDGKERNKRDLMIFVTPTIVAQNDYQSAPNSRAFLEKKGDEKPDLEWKTFDSVEPHDWTKPVTE